MIEHDGRKGMHLPRRQQPVDPNLQVHASALRWLRSCPCTGTPTGQSMTVSGSAVFMREFSRSVKQRRQWPSRER